MKGSHLFAFRRPILSEDDLAAPPDRNVLDAVEKMGKNDMLASDVAAKAGVSLSTAQKSLSALASLTRGDISVTSDGDLLYTFPQSSVKATLASNSARYKLQSKWEKDIWPNLFWGIRVAFGLSIFVSLLAIFSTFLFISAGGGSDDDDRRDNRRGGGMGFGFNAFDLFFPRTYYFSNSPYYGYYGRNDPYLSSSGNFEMQEEEKPNFFERIFSYIFGDGNPNRGLDAARLRGAAEMIRTNGGSVVAEQLAPFCDSPDPNESTNDRINVDESFVLPLVTQLGGEPTVTEDGDIVYLFPELQVSAMSKVRDSLASFGEDNAEPMNVLEEQTLEFNRAGDLSNVLAGALGVVNLGGALYLGQILSSPAMVGAQLPGVYGLVQSGYPFLLAYAVLYNAIPVLRFFYNQKYNKDVQMRNSARRKWLTVVKEGGSQVRRKLKAAASMRQKMRRLGGRVDVVYDTKKNFEDVMADKGKDELKKFDDLLNDETSFQ